MLSPPTLAKTIRRHCLPTGAQVTAVSKVRSVQNLIGVARRSLGARMGLISEPTFRLDHFPHVFGIMYAIDLAVMVICGFKTLTRLAILLPIHRVRKHEAPVATQIDIRFF